MKTLTVVDTNNSNMTSMMDSSNGTIFDVNRTSDAVSLGYSVPHVILASILVSVIMIVIIFGNLLVVIAIATDKNLKTTQNWFIASLAVADSMLGLVIMPFSLANELMGYWYFGYVWCDLWKAIDVLLCTASILSICLISLDRYWSITRAVEYSRQRTPKRAALMIAAVWLLSAVICVPPLIGWKNPLPVSEYPLCLLSDEIGYVLYSTMGSFYIPCVIMVFVYMKIFQAARRLARKSVKRARQCAASNKKDDHVAHQDDVQMAEIALEKTESNAGEECQSAFEAFEENGPELPVGKQNNKASNEKSKLIYTDSDTDSFAKQQQQDSGSAKHDRNNGGPCVAKDHGDNLEAVRITEAISTEDSVIDSPSMSPKQSVAGGLENAPHPEAAEKSKAAFPHRPIVTIKSLSNSLKKQRPRTTAGKATNGFRIASLREHERHKRRLAKARERRATIVLGLIMTAFILCWFPFFTLYIITSFCNCVGDMVFAVVFWAGYCNSALNPIIYTVFNRDFRHAFHKIICLHRCR